MIEPSIYKLLTDVSAPTAKLLEGRVYFGAGDQNIRAARVVLTTIQKLKDHTFDGPADYWTGTVQIAALAPTYQDAHTLADAISDHLDGYEGTGADFRVEIDRLEITEQADIESTAPAGQPRTTFGVALTADFQLHIDD